MQGHHQRAGQAAPDGLSQDEWEDNHFQHAFPMTGRFPRQEAIRKGSLFYERAGDSLMDLEALPVNSDMMVNELIHPINKASSKHKQRRSLYIPPASEDRPTTDIRLGKYLIRKRSTYSCDIFWYGELYTKKISAIKVYKNKCRPRITKIRNQHYKKSKSSRNSRRRTNLSLDT